MTTYANTISRMTNISLVIRWNVAYALLACATLLPAQSSLATDTQMQKTPDSATLATLRADPKVRALMDKTLKNLRFVEGGSFQMGDFGRFHSPDGLPYTRSQDNKFLHKVTLDSYSMSAYKTSYEDFDIYTNSMGLPLVGQDAPTIADRFQKAAAGVNWYQAHAYCQWLGALLDLPMDLPTEAQWEYAARNRGQYFVFATDDGSVDIGRNVWEFQQRENVITALGGHFPPSLPLGQFPPTPLGLYDMMTDGLEWTLDWYDKDYYKRSQTLNPQGPNKGQFKVLRGSRSADGEALSHGDGVTVMRGKREPKPQNFNVLSGKIDPELNTARDTSARCVVNQAIAVERTRG